MDHYEIVADRVDPVARRIAHETLIVVCDLTRVSQRRSR